MEESTTLTKQLFYDNRRRLGKAYVRLGVVVLSLCDQYDAGKFPAFELLDELKEADADVVQFRTEYHRLFTAWFPDETEEDAANVERFLNFVRNPDQYEEGLDDAPA